MTSGEWAWFLDEPLSNDETFRAPDHWTNYRLLADRDIGDGEEGYARRRWEECERVVLAEWIERKPGTRPSTWWRFSAPIPRRKGEAEWQYLAHTDLWLPGERERVIKPVVVRNLRER
jgi:hypothetical protein